MFGHEFLKHLPSLIFQQRLHLFPFALVVATLISLFLCSKISAEEVIHNSAKSILLVKSNNFLSILIIKLASKLEPISLLALFSSMLKLQTSLILSN